MKKILFLCITTYSLLYCASIEQVEEYLHVSLAEEKLLLLETQFSAMQNSFSNQNDTYDMQMLSFRFKDSLQRNLSENEMDEILQNYKNLIYLQYQTASSTPSDDNQTQAYLFQLEEDESLKERLDILENISKTVHTKKSMLVLFDLLMQPLLQSAKGGSQIDKKMMNARRDAYLQSRIDDARKNTLITLKSFSIEELEALLKILKKSSVQREIKAIHTATAYALKAFFLSIASRYDISKHDSTQKKKSNPSKK